MEIISKIKYWLSEPDEEEGTSEDTEKTIIVPDDSVIKPVILVIRLNNTKDLYRYCNLMKKGIAVIFDTKAIESVKQRFLDLISGVLMATDGTILKLENDLFICVSQNMMLKEEKEK